MIYEFNPSISKMDELKAEVQVLLPVLKAAREELGEAQANEIILGALRTWCRERFKQVGAHLPGSPKEKWDNYEKLNMARMRENDLEFEMLKFDETAVEYNVKRCIFADFFRELGETELGLVLSCDQDYYVTDEIGFPDIEYKRTQTLMEGDTFCDIRWAIKDNSVAKMNDTR